LIRDDQTVAKTLVVSVAVIMRHEFQNRFPQQAFSEGDHRCKQDSLMVLTNRSGAQPRLCFPV
jgi:hypothetical protein